MSKAITTVMFTGRRPKDLYGYKDILAYQKLNAAIAHVVIDLVKKGATRFVSGGAQGTDQVAFWAVNSVKKRYPHIQNNVAIIENQSSVWHKDDLFGQDAFDQMLKAADSIDVLLYKTFDTDSAGTLLNLRNHVMVKQSDVVIGIWDANLDFKTAKHSGTANTLIRAQQRGLALILIDPHTLTVYRNDLDPQMSKTTPIVETTSTIQEKPVSTSRAAIANHALAKLQEDISCALDKITNTSASNAPADAQSDTSPEPIEEHLGDFKDDDGHIDPFDDFDDEIFKNPPIVVSASEIPEDAICIDSEFESSADNV